MLVRIRLFARYRELAGRDVLELEMPPNATAGDAFGAVASRFPEMEPMRHSTLMAINAEYVKADVPLHDGEELVLMPPVSGGAC